MGEIVFDLNTTQLDRSGDGFKNYFSFAYHYRYGSGLWFEGMQYPYGDLLSYADGQPLFVLFFKCLKWIGIDFTGHELLLVQGLPILGLLIAAFLLHSIMHEYKVHRWWIIITVIACLGLSPQLFRFNSHYALAYCFCFPLIWYLSLKHYYKKISNLSFVAACSIIIFLLGYIHPYHLLIAVIFLMSYAVADSIIKKKVAYLPVLSAIIPLVLFLISNAMMDPFSDRPQNPFGVLEYKTTIYDLFPFYGWFTDFFDFIPGLRSSYNEGYSYPGVLFLLSPVLMAYFIIKRSTLQIPGSLKTILLAAGFCLLFSMGIHLVLTDQKILEYLPSLRQFRALGRFSWPFYYIAFIALSIITYKLIVGIGKKQIRVALFAIISLVWGTEIYGFTQKFNKHIQSYTDKDLLNEDDTIKKLLEDSSYDSDDFQAILPIPVPTEGTEKYNPHDNWLVKMKSIPYAYQSNTPMIGAYMSRTSISRILKQSQLGSSSYVTKELIDDLTDKRPLLLLIAKEDLNIYKDLLDKSFAINQTADLLLYGINPDSLSIAKKLPIPNESSNQDSVFYQSFENESEEGLMSKGALRILKQHVLYDGDIGKFGRRPLDLSIWYKIELDKSSTAHFVIEVFDQNNNKLTELSYKDRDIHRFEVLNNWVQIKKSFNPAVEAKRIKWSVNVENLLIDHVLISADSSEFVQKLEKDYYVYKHFIGKADSN